MKPKLIQDAIDNGATFLNDDDERRYFTWEKRNMIVLIAGLMAFFLLGAFVGVMSSVSAVVP